MSLEAVLSGELKVSMREKVLPPSFEPRTCPVVGILGYPDLVTIKNEVSRIGLGRVNCNHSPKTFLAPLKVVDTSPEYA